MKTIFFKYKILIVLTLTLFNFKTFSQETKKKQLIASCCTELGTCTGSDYCTACKNCSYCKHCAKNGGSCGVCSSGSRRRVNNKYSKPKSPSITENSISYKLYKGSLLYAKVALHLRKGPGIKFKIIKKLEKDSKLIYIARTDNWIKVKVKSGKTELIGYVYYKYLYLLWDSDIKKE